MRRSTGVVAFLALVLCAAACERSDSGEELAASSEAVVISESETGFAVAAPAGDYNGFDLNLGWSYGSLSDGWTSTGRPVYSIRANFDCLDCFLPSNIEIGQAIQNFVPQACLPTEGGESDCELSDDIEGVQLSDLLFQRTDLNGEPIEITNISVSFYRVHEKWNDDTPYDGEAVPFPRVDSATAELELQADGSLTAVSDWVIAEDALNSDP